MAAHASMHSEKCAEEGCPEVHRIAFRTLRERRAWFEHNRKRPYRCSRHDAPDVVVTPDAPAKTGTLVVQAQRHGGLQWANPAHPEQSGSKVDGGLFMHPLFRAFATDWPEGTVLHVTVYAETPEQAQQAAGAL